jgi:putative MATE family efflux protein
LGFPWPLPRFFDRELVSRVVRISLPMIISELSNSVYALTDTYFVSGLGRDALAGVGLSSYLSWLFFVVISMFYNGVLIYVAQAYGAGKIELGRRGLSEAIIYGLMMALGISIIGYLVGPWIMYLQIGGRNNVWFNAVEYFSIRIWGLPISLIVWSIDASLRAVGATRESMYANLSSVSTNIVLDPLMIYGYLGFPRMGVSGAAMATIISIILMLPLEYYYLSRIGLEPYGLHKPLIIYRIMSLGVPVMLERLIFATGNNIYISLISRCGAAALAAHNIGIRIESLVFMPGFAFSMAASALVGQEIGSGNINGGKRIGDETIKIGTLIISLIGVAVALTSYYLTAPFSPDPIVHRLASIYLILAGLSEPGLALVMIIGGAIRGAGNTRIPLIINVAGLYASRITPAIMLVEYFGVIGAWIAMFIDVYVRGTIFLYVYRKYFEKIARKIV